MNKDEWDKVININLTSTFLLSKYVIKKMLKIAKRKSAKNGPVVKVIGIKVIIKIDTILKKSLYL